MILVRLMAALCLMTGTLSCTHRTAEEDHDRTYPVSTDAPAEEQPAEAGEPATGTTEEKVTVPREALTLEDKSIVEMPGLRLDRKQRILDLDATVIRQEGDWLELLACTPGSREHEALLTVSARPSQINLALIMMGLKSGTPLKAVRIENAQPNQPQFTVIPPSGDRVAVTLVVTDKEGKQTEVPANEWIVQRDTGEPLPGNHWIFTGSEMYEHEGEPMFLADINGTVLSLVNFGDDLLARQTDLTSRTDGEILAANTEVIPEIGTKVLIRLRPVDPPAAEEGEKQEE